MHNYQDKRETSKIFIYHITLNVSFASGNHSYDISMCVCVIDVQVCVCVLKLDAYNIK